MRPEPTILVMAGSREAHGLVTALRSRRRRVIASLPEPERMFGGLPVPTRLGRFASVDAFAQWVRAEAVSTVIDASHPFDDDVARVAGSACTRMALPYLRLLRPPWVETPRDRWLNVGSIAQAARAVPKDARVLTNTGRATLHEYADFSGMKLFVRQMQETRTERVFPFVEYISGQPPFSQFQEQELFRRLRISHLICRNVGGAASMSKLLAARAMSLAIYMVARRPHPGHLPVVETIAEALAWEADG